MAVLVPAEMSVGEGDGMVQVCVTAQAPAGGTERSVTVMVTTNDGTGKFEQRTCCLAYQDLFYSDG
jgi:hypothetical protein